MSFLIYGAYGYTGTLITRRAVERGWSPLIAGRDEEKLDVLAAETGTRYRAVSLDDRRALDALLEEVPLVLHCAGPFAHTAAPMAAACLRTGTHYLDITGEIDVFEALAQEDEEARAAGAMLLPGVGFDVVPSDCLAAHLHERLPEATQLELAIFGQGGVSRGTATTAIENMGMGGRIRRNGTLMRVPMAWKSRMVDFGEGPVSVVTMPWGDVATAYHSTGIPHVTTYMRFPDDVQRAMSWGRPLQSVMAAEPVQALLKRAVQRGKPGPTPQERARGASYVWGEALADTGQRVVARVRGMEGYTLTVEAALKSTERVLGGDATPGFQTPSTAFGSDFAWSIDGVEYEDVV